MFKSLNYIVATLFISASFLSGCLFNDPPCIDPDDTLGSETFIVNDPFEGISLSFPSKVSITQGNEVSIIANGSQNLLDEIDLIVEDKVLVIENDNLCVLDSDVEFEITLPQVNYLAISGSSSINSTETIQVQDIDLSISGSANLALALNATNINGEVSGSGEIILTGMTNNLDFTISGSANVKGFGLESTDANLSISGAGNMEVKVLNSLDVMISGSGSVSYKGTPDINSEISGSGMLIDAN